MRRPRIWRKVLVWVSNIGTFLDNLLLGSYFQLVSSNRMVNKNIEKCKIEEFTGDLRLRHDEEILRRAVDNSVKIIKEIEQKSVDVLRGSLLTVSIVVAFAGITGTNIGSNNEPTWFIILASILLFSAIIYLMLSGLFAIKAFNIGIVWYMGLKDYEPLVSKHRQAMNQIHCIEQNHSAHAMKVNRLQISFRLLRNGLIAVSAFGVWNFIVGPFIN